jgi:hypothetical protein
MVDSRCGLNAGSASTGAFKRVENLRHAAENDCGRFLAGIDSQLFCFVTI